MGAFDPGFENLPRVIPIFPLTGVLLLPEGVLPLNIFEPRYLAMTRDALADEQRIIGMVQPRVPDPDDNRGPAEAAIESDRTDTYRTGCAGRITGFQETEDGRYHLTLKGVCRFNIAEDMADKGGYRRVLVDYRDFRDDIGDAPALEIDRDRLLVAVKQYFEQQEISASWETVEATSDERLVTSLAMTCPFGPNERQALLEAPTMANRAEIVITLLEMALMGPGGSDISH